MKFEIYCDESRPDLLASTSSSADFMIIGSLWLEAEKRKRYDHTRRVTVVVRNYVVVIRLTGPGKAVFVTAYVADSPLTIDRIRSGPKWDGMRA